MISRVLDREVEKVEGAETNGLAEEDIQELRDRGYEILHKLGEGQTREAYLAKYTRGEVDKLRVVKIPKTEVNPDSICTLINRSKRDLDSAEVSISNEIQHPNIVEVVDNFRLDGKTVNVESYYGGEDLENLVKTMGPIKDESRFNEIFGQTIRALKYLNWEKDILHRDIKPSNILVTKNRDVKISDLQNAARKSDIREISMPTRGGTPYTYPSLLNALILGRNARATERTEIYALGGTMFYALTGENPFDYNISSNPNGKSITIGNEIFRIKLTDNGKNLEEITEKTHEAKLRQALKNVPKKHKNLVYRCLTTNDKKAFSSMFQVERAFEKINSGFGKKLREGVAKTAKYAVPLLTAAALAGAVAGAIITSENRELKPTLREVLSKADYRNFSLEDLKGYDEKRVDNFLRDYMLDAEKRLSDIKVGKDVGGIKFITRFSNDVHLMSKRVVSSWLRACYLHQDKMKKYEQDREERLLPSFVPRNFVLRNRMADSDLVIDRVKIAHGIMYLKQCFGPETNVADVFANYFSSREDINTARVKARSINYFTRTKTATPGGYAAYSQEGYGSHLPFHQKELINSAVAIYRMTNEEGEIDFSKIPKYELTELIQ